MARDFERAHEKTLWEMVGTLSRVFMNARDVPEETLLSDLHTLSTSLKHDPEVVMTVLDANDHNGFFLLSCLLKNDPRPSVVKTVLHLLFVCCRSSPLLREKVECFVRPRLYVSPLLSKFDDSVGCLVCSLLVELVRDSSDAGDLFVLPEDRGALDILRRHLGTCCDYEDLRKVVDNAYLRSDADTSSSN